ncbi:MAG: penicillin-binding protein 2 [Silvanigrellales bacterium]|nr:penicillin-binding protein 2 [Silvanigrellales bacterium]
MDGKLLRNESLVDNKRLYFALGGFLILLVLLAGRLWYLQILKGKDFAIASERNRVREVTKPAPRGLIYDADGNLLLANRPFFDLVIIPQYLQNRQETIRIVSDLFSIPAEQIERRLNEAQGIPHFVPVRIKRNLSLHEVALVESNKFFLPGVDVDTAPRRDYVQNESAHLFGYLGEVTPKELDSLNSASRDYQYRLGSIIGKLGVEKKYEQYLRGVEGKDYLQVDAYGRLQSSSALDFGLNQKKLGRRGYDVYLTLDDEVQRAAVEAFRNKNGALVALDPRNGAVLGYVSNPNFSLSMYQDGLTSEDWQLLQNNPFKPLLDKVTGGAYPPGSTFKIVTAIAALEEGVVNESRAWPCNGVFTLGNGRWRCWKKEGHGWVNLRRAIELSCDVYFYQVGNLLGVDRIAKWARAFGLGEKTGLDLNMEVPGIVPSTDWKLRARAQPWQSGDTINVSIGQGYNLMTPIQIANLFAAMGNGGKVFRPYLLKKVVDEAGQVVAEEKPLERHRVQMRPENLALVKAGLFDVVNSPTGTGKKSKVEGFTVAGKTGTAQTSALRKPSEQEDVAFQLRDHAWFAAYSPAENPEIAVVALSENDGGGGGSNAAPIVQKVLEAYWRKRHPEKFPKRTAAADLAQKLDEEPVPPMVDILPAVVPERSELAPESPDTRPPLSLPSSARPRSELAPATTEPATTEPSTGQGDQTGVTRTP